MVLFTMLLIPLTEIFAQEVSPPTLRKPEMLAVIPGMWVRIKAPSINRALIGVPWITGSFIAANTDTIVMKSDVGNLILIPLSTVQQLQIKTAKHWQEAPVSQVMFSNSRVDFANSSTDL